jgi:hypothetical protein
MPIPIKLESRTPKYKNKKTVVDGITFDSRREANRYGDLKIDLHNGAIEHLELQKRYDFVINGVKIGFYKADFTYWDVIKERLVVEDVKGMKTRVYGIKKKLMKALHGVDILET